MTTNEKTLPIISREDALTANLKHYFTGVACRHGHIARRKTTTRVCVECAKVYAKRDYRKKLEADPEGVRAAARAAVAQHYQRNRPAILAAKAAYYRENAETIKQRARERNKGGGQASREVASDNAIRELD